MPNINQNNEIEYISKNYSLMQFQNMLMRIGGSRVKQGQRTNISETKKIQKIVKDIFKNKIKHIKKKMMY